jgi:hypothetical protein
VVFVVFALLLVVYGQETWSVYEDHGSWRLVSGNVKNSIFMFFMDLLIICSSYIITFPFRVYAGNGSWRLVSAI